MIHEAQSLRDPQALTAQYLRVESDVAEQIAEGMHFAVVCSEDAPRWEQQNVSEEQLAKTYLGTAFMRGMRAVCEKWPRGPVDPDFGAPLQSSVPTLILSGSNDPVTPERYANEIMKGLRNAKHVVAAGQGHGQLATGCIPRLTDRIHCSGLADGARRSVCAQHPSDALHVVADCAGAMIRLEGLSKKFGAVQALNDVSFEAHDGRITGSARSQRRRQVDDVAHPEHGAAPEHGARHRRRPRLRGAAAAGS